MAYIYALTDPDSGDIRYIGKADNVIDRLKSHLNDCSSTRKARWIRSLVGRGKRPELLILEEVGNEQWQDAESKWIAHYRLVGADLCNHTDGGEGLRNPSAETRAKLSELRRSEWLDPVGKAKWLSILRSPGRRQKISDSLSGKKKSMEHVAKLPQNQPGRKLSPEHAERSRELLREHGYRHPLGVPMTEEVKRKIGESLRGNSHTLGRVMPEHEKLRRSEALRGRPKSEETRQRMREAAFRRWQKARG